MERESEALRLDQARRTDPRIPQKTITTNYRRGTLATVLRVSEQSIDRRITHAYTLTSRYCKTFEALGEGHISEQHTVVIVDAGHPIGLGDDLATVLRRAAYETAVLTAAASETPARLRPIAKRLAAQFAETSVEQLHESARRRRSVHLIDREDGMCDLIAHLPAIEAHGIYDRLTRLSRAVQQMEAERSVGELATSVEVAAVTAVTEITAVTAVQSFPNRTRNEIRADLFSDLLLTVTAEEPQGCVEPGTKPSTEPGTQPGVRSCTQPSGRSRIRNGLAAIRAQVQITVTDTALFAGLGGPDLGNPGRQGAPANFDRGSASNRLEGAASLTGYGPVDFDSARHLAATAPHWNLVTRDTETGTVLSVETYRPSNKIRRFLRARDEHCRFPGCRVPVHRCDVDHTVDAQYGGKTSTTNLSHLCRGHHTLKHHGGWSAELRDDGDLEWNSPTGRVHVDRPPSKVRFLATRAGRMAETLDEPPPY